MLPSGSVQGEAARLKLRQEDRKQAAGVTGVGGGGEAVRGGGGEEGGGPGDTSPAGGRVQPPPRGSLQTGADHSGRRRVNQSHVDPLRAVLWTDDLRQTVGPRLAQQLTWKGVWAG